MIGQKDKTLKYKFHPDFIQDLYLLAGKQLGYLLNQSIVPDTSFDPNVLISDLKKSRICPIWGQSDPLWSQTYHPCEASHSTTGMSSSGKNWAD